MGRRRSRFAKKARRRLRPVWSVAGLLLRMIVRMVRRWRFSTAAAGVLLLGGLLFFSPWGCTPTAEMNGELPTGDRMIRVNILPGLDRVTLRASHPPDFYTTLDRTERVLNLPHNAEVLLRLAPRGWYIGQVFLGSGELIIRPQTVGSVLVNNVNYRGRYRFVPVSGGRFDVVNDVDLDEYLKGVLARELLSNWHINTYRAQAVVARTYALYEKKTTSASQHFDVYASERSQVYGGIPAETAGSRAAASETAGIVVAYGPPGQERIFKAYFSSCCGGITQSVADAFGEPAIEPLSAQNTGTLCSASPRFNWGPVVISKEELTRRVQAWGRRRRRPEQNMGMIRGVEIGQRNRFGRPSRFVIYDSRGLRYTLLSEEFRWAFNTDATDGVRLGSSFIENIINEPERVRFVGCHGFGHGVGMCQWCAEARARAGMSYEDIVLAAYPGSRLVRAY